MEELASPIGVIVDPTTLVTSSIWPYLYARPIPHLAQPLALIRRPILKCELGSNLASVTGAHHRMLEGVHLLLLGEVAVRDRFRLDVGWRLRCVTNRHDLLFLLDMIIFSSLFIYDCLWSLGLLRLWSLVSFCASITARTIVSHFGYIIFLIID